ncbi:uncharacterized protein LOC143205776 [Rhynchophorus ferrugineus]|uniref:uncharacterized protein LOC143205776 n=1 Tax=Rhynchophorus ferrugineus TaxID=354439 RepID=UPI003FCCC672
MDFKKTATKRPASREEPREDRRRRERSRGSRPTTRSRTPSDLSPLRKRTREDQREGRRLRLRYEVTGRRQHERTEERRRRAGQRPTKEEESRRHEVNQQTKGRQPVDQDGGKHVGRQPADQDGGQHEGRQPVAQDGGQHEGRQPVAQDGGQHEGRQPANQDGGKQVGRQLGNPIEEENPSQLGDYPSAGTSTIEERYVVQSSQSAACQHAGTPSIERRQAMPPTQPRTSQSVPACQATDTPKIERHQAMQQPRPGTGQPITGTPTIGRRHPVQSPQPTACQATDTPMIERHQAMQQPRPGTGQPITGTPTIGRRHPVQSPQPAACQATDTPMIERHQATQQPRPGTSQPITGTPLIRRHRPMYSPQPNTCPSARPSSQAEGPQSLGSLQSEAPQRTSLPQQQAYHEPTEPPQNTLHWDTVQEGPSNWSQEAEHWEEPLPTSCRWGEQHTGHPRVYQPEAYGEYPALNSLQEEHHPEDHYEDYPQPSFQQGERYPAEHYEDWPQQGHQGELYHPCHQGDHPPTSRQSREPYQVTVPRGDPPLDHFRGGAQQTRLPYLGHHQGGCHRSNPRSSCHQRGHHPPSPQPSRHPEDHPEPEPQGERFQQGPQMSDQHNTIEAEQLSLAIRNASLVNPSARNDLVPIFDPERSDTTAANWLYKIDQLGSIHGWSETNRSYIMQSKLDGLAKVWYNSLDEYEKNWEGWKLALSEAFPSHERFMDNMWKLLTRKKLPDETMVRYFYMKNILTKKCELSRRNAVICIIDGLPKSLHGPAKAGNYQSPEALFQGFLSQMDDSGSGSQLMTASPATGRQIRCYICNKTGHMARMCRGIPHSLDNSGQSAAREPARRTEQKHPSFPTIGRVSRKCTICNREGHSREGCWYTKRAAVKTLHRQVNDTNSKYFVSVQIQGTAFRGYLDTGSQINVANMRVAKSLNLQLETPDTYIKGFGNQITYTKGQACLVMQINGVSVESTLHFVKTEMGNVDIIIGQPIINSGEIEIRISGEKVTLLKVTKKCNQVGTENDGQVKKHKVRTVQAV